MLKYGVFLMLLVIELVLFGTSLFSYFLLEIDCNFHLLKVLIVCISGDTIKYYIINSLQFVGKGSSFRTNFESGESFLRVIQLQNICKKFLNFLTDFQILIDRTLKIQSRESSVSSAL